MRTARPAGTAGFSLIELLVALVIFATMAGIAYTGLSAVTRTHAALDLRERDLDGVGRALAMVERDLRAVARRPVRGSDGQRLPALLGQANRIELSSYGRGRAAGADLGLVERIGYGRDGDGLHRERWPVLDRSQRSQPDRRLLIAQALPPRWRYLDAGNRWQSQWPPPNDAGTQALPRAVEVVIAHPRLGEVRRLVELPPALEGT